LLHVNSNSKKGMDVSARLSTIMSTLLKTAIMVNPIYAVEMINLLFPLIQSTSHTYTPDKIIKLSIYLLNI
jgi:hypothetical protein